MIESVRSYKIFVILCSSTIKLFSESAITQTSKPCGRHLYLLMCIGLSTIYSSVDTCSLYIDNTRIMISKGQRPFFSTRAVRVFWHFLSKIEYLVTLNRPLGSNQIKAVNPYS